MWLQLAVKTKRRLAATTMILDTFTVKFKRYLEKKNNNVVTLIFNFPPSSVRKLRTCHQYETYAFEQDRTTAQLSEAE